MIIQPMKAITVWNPWAWLLALELKLYETRGWATNYRGPIAIHAAARDVLPWFQREVGKDVRLAIIDALAPFHMSVLQRLPRGCIIATAELVGCYQVASTPQKSMLRDDHSFLFYDNNSSPHSTKPLEIVHVQPNVSVKFGLGEKEALFGDWSRFRYAWELANVKLMPEPIPAKGRQGLWTWEGVRV